ncbi:MAG: ABC transporter ATP-binding protein [Ignavibacteriaceae bacterium]
MLKVENLKKEFDKKTAVDNISFEVTEGRIFGLLGPNGAGKTTTIRTVLNIIKPTSGSISFNGKPITEDFFNYIGYLPEERGLYRKSKVIDVIIYFAQLKGIEKRDAIKRGDQWLKRLTISNYRDNRIEELSKGNQQKIQFISAVLHEPKLLILDEPFSGFDPINQMLIKDVILSFVDSGKVVILSTHQMETAEKMCRDILLINNGKEVIKGDLNEVKKRFGGNYVKLSFSGDASFLNSLPYVLHTENFSNYAEIQLKDDKAPHEFLKDIANRLQINHFSVIDPTLNKIFIDAINKTGLAV